MNDMTSTDYFNRRVLQGLCGDCGNPIGKDGTKHRCRVCADKINTYNAETREWMKERGFCPICHKNRIYGSEKKCVECRAKSANLAQRRRDNNREEYNRYARELHARKVEEWKSKGLCSRCGRERDDKRFETCSRCRRKSREQKRKDDLRKRDYIDIRKYRSENNLCICGKPVIEGQKLCKEHYDIAIERIKKLNDSKHNTKEDEQMMKN